MADSRRAGQMHPCILYVPNPRHVVCTSSEAWAPWTSRQNDPARCRRGSGHRWRMSSRRTCHCWDRVPSCSTSCPMFEAKRTFSSAAMSLMRLDIGRVQSVVLTDWATELYGNCWCVQRGRGWRTVDGVRRTVVLIAQDGRGHADHEDHETYVQKQPQGLDLGPRMNSITQLASSPSWLRSKNTSQYELLASVLTATQQGGTFSCQYTYLLC